MALDGCRFTEGWLADLLGFDTIRKDGLMRSAFFPFLEGLTSAKGGAGLIWLARFALLSYHGRVG